MVKIEKESVDTKDKVISDLIEEAKENKKDAWFSIIRGSLYKTEQFHLHQLLNSEEATSFIKGMIHASKNDKNSMHQVDYVVCAFTNPIGMLDAKAHYRADPVNFRENMIDEMKLKDIDPTEKNHLIILVLSEGNYEMISYDMICSKEGPAVVSPNPVHTDSGSIHSAKIMIQDVILPDFFQVKYEELERVKYQAGQLKHLFTEDKNVFPNKSEFMASIEPKPKKKKKNKKDKKSKKGFKAMKL